MISTPREILKGLGEKCLVTNGVAWHPVNHTGAAESWVDNQRWPNCVEKREVNQKTGSLGNQ